MQLAYELLPVWAGQDENLPTAISQLRRCSPIYLNRRSSFVVRRAPTPILGMSCVARPTSSANPTHSKPGHPCDAGRATQDRTYDWSDKNVRPRDEVNYGRRSTR